MDIYTVRPAISLHPSGSCRRTTTSARRRRHGPLGGRPRGQLGGDHLVHDPVLLRLLGGHEEIAVGVPLDLLHGTGRWWARMRFSSSRIRRISLAWMSMSVACPCTPPSGWWSMIRAWGRANRLPLAPAASSSAPREAACPMQIVEMAGLTYCILS